MKTVPMAVTYVDHMGSDLSVANAARVSFDKVSKMETHLDTFSGEFKQVLSPADAKLIGYLAKHNHWSPFAHTSISLRIKAPLFVARQLGKHQVGLAWNEVSRRYVATEPEMFYPDAWRCAAENVKQGSSSYPFQANTQQIYDHLDAALSLYQGLVEDGCCPEQARMVLPQAMMTEWIWTGSLYAFARVCILRLDSHTQKETRDVAQLISDAVEYRFPVSWAALVKHD